MHLTPESDTFDVQGIVPGSFPDGRVFGLVYIVSQEIDRG